MPAAAGGAPRTLAAADLDLLVQALRGRGYRTYGPVLGPGAVEIKEISSAGDLARGVVDEQDGGTYRVRRSGDLWFSHTTPADSWKKLLFPPRLKLWSARSAGDRVEFTPEPGPDRPTAMIGVRSCDLGAIAIQDRVFLGGDHPDPAYRARREGAFIVAVGCARAVSTCFCASMGSGPRPRAGYDVALTELEGPHRFMVEAGSDAGREVLDELHLAAAPEADPGLAEAQAEATAASMTRSMPEGIAATLRDSFPSPRWAEVAKRCLSCGNCTLACPTCFCSAVEDTADLTGQVAERSRRWDSCFAGAHSYIHGGSVRPSTASRYRQWMTHKLSTWHDQFGTPGCTGCGRCIAWCPVAIDITEEAAALTAAGGRS